MNTRHHFSKKLVAIVMCGALLVPFGAMAAEPSQADQLPDEALQIIEELNDSVMAAFEKNDYSLDEDDFASDELVSQLEGRNDYLRLTQKSYEIVNSNSDFFIDKVNFVNDATIKVLATRIVDLTLYNDKTGEFQSYGKCGEGYILTNKNNKWKISRVIDSMYGPNDALEEFKDNFDNDETIINKLSKNNNSIIEDLSGIDYLNLPSMENYLSSNPDDISDSGASAYYMYSKAKACAYAKQWAKSRNPAFADYSYSGGDCANFTSQCLNAGGMTYTNSWFPGSTQFIRVTEQRDMLINTGRAVGYYQALPVYPNGLDTTGTVVHYTNGIEWYHAVIITEDPQTGYANIKISAHTEDHLNWPIEPNINNIRSFRCV